MTKKNCLKNWRPISLVCVDYKILTKMISNRLKLTLPKAISREQTCSIPNSLIFSNLFTICELIHHSKIKNINSYIVTVDQEKAFDKVNRKFLYEGMEKLGYSRTFSNYIKKIYKNTESTISNNSFLSSLFSIIKRSKTRMSPIPSLINY